MSKATSAGISEGYLRRHAGTSSFKKGQAYFRDGAVVLVTSDSNRIDATVEGSAFAPYSVKVELHVTGVRRASCTCAFEDSGWCKHIVAAMLAATNHNGAGAAAAARPIEERLADLQTFELQTLVAQACREVSQFATFARLWLGDAGAAGQTNEPVRKNMLRLARTEELSSGNSLDGRLDDLFERALSALDRDAAATAVTMLEKITAIAAHEYESMDDSDGDFAAFIGSLGHAWIDASLMLETNQRRRSSLATRIESWQTRFGDYGAGEELGVAALVLEESAEAAELLLDNDDLRSLHAAQLRIFARRGLTNEYLALARKSGARTSYLSMLVYAGNVDCAIAEAPKLIKKPAEALHLVALLCEREKPDDALAIGERGLGLRGEGLGELGSRMRDLARERGNPALALRAAAVVVRDWPTLQDYRALEKAAGAQWKRMRPNILNDVRLATNVEGAICILLAEKLVPEAIRMLERGDVYVSDELLETAVRAAINTESQWALDTARGQAERIMNPGKSEYYHHAGRWLGHARAAYRQAGLEQEWQSYRAALLLRHKRKLKLVAILKTLA